MKKQIEELREAILIYQNSEVDQEDRVDTVVGKAEAFLKEADRVDFNFSEVKVLSVDWVNKEMVIQVPELKEVTARGSLFFVPDRPT
jgi:hypothetical protein